MDPFRLHERGMTAWKASFDQVIVENLPAGMRALKVEVNSVAVYERVLTAEEARHLADLLAEPISGSSAD